MSAALSFPCAALACFKAPEKQRGTQLCDDGGFYFGDSTGLVIWSGCECPCHSWRTPSPSVHPKEEA